VSLSKVPVEDIAALTRATKIDLSNNQLTCLPSTFATSLKNISRLDLSSNKLKEIPSNIHHLENLRHLDLYNNQLTDLPVTFCQLRKLKWLDLKGNSLSPALRKAAGDCLNQKECEAAARNVVSFLKQQQQQMENDRLEKLRKEKEMEEKKQRAEDEKLAKKRAERKAAKEKRKAEQLALAKSQTQANGKAHVVKKVEAPKPATKKVTQKKSKQGKGWSLLGCLNLLLVLCLTGALAGGLYIYTDGDLSKEGITAAFPRLVENSNQLINITVEAFQPENLKQTAQTVSTNVAESCAAAWAALEEYTGDLSMYTTPVVEAGTLAWGWLKVKSMLCYDWICDNVDWAAMLAAVKSAWKFLHDQWLVMVEELSKNEAFMSGVETMKTHAATVVEFLSILWASMCKHLAVVVEYLQQEGPVIFAAVKEQASGALHAAKQSLEGLVK